jgi:hypothetical protein
MIFIRNNTDECRSWRKKQFLPSSLKQDEHVCYQAIKMINNIIIKLLKEFWLI